MIDFEPNVLTAIQLSSSVVKGWVSGGKNRMTATNMHRINLMKENVGYR